MLFTRVRIKYKGTTFDCTNFFSLSTTNQDNYQNSVGVVKMGILIQMFKSALFGMDQMTFDTYTEAEKFTLASAWYEQSEKIVLNREEPNIVY